MPYRAVSDGQRFVELFKTQYLYMMYVWGHSFEFPRDDNWELMEEFCQMIGGREDIWYATNIPDCRLYEGGKKLKIYYRWKSGV